jgi:hypothetical protein
MHWARGSVCREIRISLSPMIKDRQRGEVRFICGGDVVGEASREASVRTEPHPTSQPVFYRHPIKRSRTRRGRARLGRKAGKPRLAQTFTLPPQPAFDRHPIKIENEHENEDEHDLGKGLKGKPTRINEVPLDYSAEVGRLTGNKNGAIACAKLCRST